MPQLLGRPEICLPSAGAKTNELIAKQMIEHWLWTFNKQLQDPLQSTVSFLNTPKSAILHNTWEHMDKHGHDVIHPWKFFWGGLNWCPPIDTQISNFYVLHYFNFSVFFKFTAVLFLLTMEHTLCPAPIWINKMPPPRLCLLRLVTNYLTNKEA